MATEKEASCQSCASDPNFAIICSFLERFANSCGIIHPTFAELQKMIEDSQEEVPQALIDLHVKLLRKARKSVTTEKWERALVKFCHSYSSEDGWELERIGYKKSKVAVKLRLLKMLLDSQFDLNTKFKTDINKLTAQELRVEALGRDKSGQQYWCQFDPASNIRVYKEDMDEESWDLVAKDREGLVSLISQLSADEEFFAAISTNEDSSSQEIDKPITDTGQPISNGASGEDSIDNAKLILENGSTTHDESTVKKIEEESIDNLTEEVILENKNCDRENLGVLSNENENSRSNFLLVKEKNESIDKKEVSSKDCDEEKSKVVNSSKVNVDCASESEVLKSNTKLVPNVKADTVTTIDLVDKKSNLIDSVESAEIVKLKSLTVTDAVKEDSIKDEIKKSVNEEKSVNKEKSVNSNVLTNKPKEFMKQVNEKSLVVENVDRAISFKVDISERSIGKEDIKIPVVTENVKKLYTPEKFQFPLEMKGIKYEIPSRLEIKEQFSKTILERRSSIEMYSSCKESVSNEEKACDVNKQSVSVIDNNSCVDLSNKKPVPDVDKRIDVAEELKQRGALLKTTAPHFRGKGTGSKLDQIFGLKRGLDLSKPPESQPLRAHFVGSGQSQFGSQILDKLKFNSSISLSGVTNPGNYSQCLDKTDLSVKRQVEDLSFRGDKRRIPEGLSIIPVKKPHVEESSKIEVSEAIEEPMMLVKGEGSGKECEIGNPNIGMFRKEISRFSVMLLKKSHLEQKCESKILEDNDVEISETIEEPVMLFFGEGSGRECETGNPGSDAGDDGKNVNSCHKTGNVENINETNAGSNEIVGERSAEDSDSKSVGERHKKTSKLWSIDKICNPTSLNENNELNTNDICSNQEKEIQVNGPNSSNSSTKSLPLSLTNAKNDIEKNLRRKSIDNSDIDDKETEPPEAKKTKVISESMGAKDIPIESVCNTTSDISTINESSKNDSQGSEKNDSKNLINECKENVDTDGLNSEDQDRIKNLNKSSKSSLERFVPDQSVTLNKNNISDLKNESSRENLKKVEQGNIPGLDNVEENSSEPANSADGDDTSSEFKGFVPPESTEKENNGLSILRAEANKLKIFNSLSTNSNTTSLTENETTTVDDKLTSGDSKTDDGNSKINKDFKNLEISGLNVISNFSTVENNSVDKNLIIQTISDKQDSNTDNKINSKSKHKPAPKSRRRRSSTQLQTEVALEESKEVDKEGVDSTTEEPKQKNEKKTTPKSKNVSLKKLESTELGNTKEESLLELVHSDDTSNKFSKKTVKGKSVKFKNEFKDETSTPPTRGRNTRASKRVNNVTNIKPLPDKEENNTENSDQAKESVVSDENIVKDDERVSKPEEESIVSEEKTDTVDSDKRDIKKFNKNSKNKIKEPVNRKRRSSKRVGEKDSNDESENIDKEEEKTDEEGAGGKRRKIKGKRVANKALRRSIEEKRDEVLSSEEEGVNEAEVNDDKDEELLVERASNKAASKILKKKGRPKKEVKTESSQPKKEKTKPGEKYSRVLLGLDIPSIPEEMEIPSGRSSRHSSRIAQIKIREQAERREIEEAKFLSLQDQRKRKKTKNKDEKQSSKSSSKQKKKKIKEIENKEEKPIESIETKKKKKRKRRDPVRAFNEGDPWKSSSESSSSQEEEDEEEHELEEEEELIFKSDHEFSPESDLENDADYVPVRRARTAQKVPSANKEADEENDSDEYACQKCQNSDHPEWILLCDKCDKGWHASCLRPTLFLIPEGDWFCPPCSHLMLVEQLQNKLKDFDKDSKRRENEELRRKRLAYVGISLDNVLPSGGHGQAPDVDEESSSESDSEESESESSSYDSEPVYQLRQRRQNVVSYKFNEFDELINSAIQDELEGKMALKDYVKPKEAKIVKSEGEENTVEQNENTELDLTTKEEMKMEKKVDDMSKDTGKKKEAKSGDEEDSEEEDDEDDDEEDGYIPPVVPSNPKVWPRARKKTRRLNCLDDPSDDDGSDEDFKGSSFDEDEEDEFDGVDSDDSGDYRGRSKRGRREPVRRSSRTRTSRFDKEFINDDSDESDAPRRKKTRRIWTESESESDETWGRKKKKSYSAPFKTKRRGKQNRRRMVIEDDSENDTPKIAKKKRQRKIKYGGLDDLNYEELPSRRTRGCKINYQEVLGSDTEEEILNPKSKSKKPPKIDDDEDEFVPKDEEENGSGLEEDDGDEEEEEDNEGNEKDGDSTESEANKEDEKIQEKELPVVKKVTKVELPKGLKKKQPHKVKEENIEKVSDKSREVKEKLNAHLEAHKTKPFPVKFGNNVSKFPKSQSMEEPKYMIVPPPTPLIQDDSFGSTKISTIPTPVVGNIKAENFSEQPHEIKKELNESEQFAVNYANKPPKMLESDERPPSLTISSALESKLANRNPPIKIRSGVPVNAGRKSPVLGNPVMEYSEKNMSGPISKVSVKSVEKINIKSESDKIKKAISEDELSDEEDYEDLLEEEEEEDEDEVNEDTLEEGEIPRRIAAQMKRVEEQLRRQSEKDSKVREGNFNSQSSNILQGTNNPSPVTSDNLAAKPPDQTPPVTTQPTTPLLRVVSPLKLMANPPGPLQSTFMHSGPRLPLSAPQQRMQMIPQQRLPLSIPPMSSISDDPASPKRKGRGRGKKQLAQEQAAQEQSMPQDPAMAGSGSVIRGILQAPQAFSPTKFQQQYPPPHSRMPFNPAMGHRMQRPSNPVYHSGHHPLDPSPSGGGPIAIQQPTVKQEASASPLVPISTPVSSPNKPIINTPINYLRPPGPPPGLRYPAESSSPRHPMPYPPSHPNQLPPKPQGGYSGYPPPQPPSHLPPQPPQHIPPPPSNYHYGNYNNPVGGDDVPPPSYQGSSYPEPYIELNNPAVETSNSKSYDDEGSGEFGGLVSYFSSQREDDIDT